jgi:hypothetical protein
MEHLVWTTGTQRFIFWDLRPPSEVLRSRLPADLDRRSALGLMKGDAATLMSKIVRDPEMEVVVEEMLDLGPNDVLGPILSGSYFNQWCECPHCGKLGIAPEGEAQFWSVGVFLRYPSSRCLLQRRGRLSTPTIPTTAMIRLA